MKHENRKLKGLFSVILLVLVTLIPSLPSYAAEDTTRELVVGGTLFGLKMQTSGAMVVGLEEFQAENGRVSPARDAGIKNSDMIVRVNGQAVSSVSTVTGAIEASDGRVLELTVIRNGEEKSIHLTPIRGSDGKHRAGMWLRDSAAGIGTVTYLDPKTYEFAGLGHGVCDGDTLALIPMRRGTVTGVSVERIVKGQSRIPGEIKGVFKGGKCGALTSNTEHGVYGAFTEIPPELGQKMRVASLSEVKTGQAYIRCAVSGKVRDYSINIEKVTKGVDGCKNFSIRVTDKALLELTGGIIQGMSGSPIHQNGKLIGAVTHVTVNDPACGYGIYIGNMIS